MQACHGNERRRAIRWALMAVAASAALWMAPGLCVRATAGPATAPSEMDYTGSSGTTTVTGTSTLHDWSAKSNTINGTLQISGSWTGPGPDLKSIQITIPVNTLKSSEGSGMDDTMYGALKEKANPSITYGLKSANLKSKPSKDDPTFHYEATGRLNVAGSERDENLTLDVQPSGEDKLTIHAQAQMKMTDFGIKPPTAMLGMIRSGDEVTVTVTWQLAKRVQ
jgi:polyisoprenoid-binding protein YceI